MCSDAQLQTILTVTWDNFWYLVTKRRGSLLLMRNHIFMQKYFLTNDWPFIRAVLLFAAIWIQINVPYTFFFFSSFGLGDCCSFFGCCGFGSFFFLSLPCNSAYFFPEIKLGHLKPLKYLHLQPAGQSTAGKNMLTYRHLWNFSIQMRIFPECHHWCKYII